MDIERRSFFEEEEMKFFINKLEVYKNDPNTYKRKIKIFSNDFEINMQHIKMLRGKDSLATK